MDKQIRVRVNDKEMALFKGIAGEMNISISDFIRYAAHCLAGGHEFGDIASLLSFTNEQYSLIQDAADSMGQTFDEFVITAAIDAATPIVQLNKGK